MFSEQALARMGMGAESSDIFVSYARSDGSTYASRLVTHLTAAGYRVWWDQRSLDCYADFTSELEMAIARTRIMVVCVTAGATSPDSFVRREIGYALAIHKPIIPVILDSALPPISIFNITRVQFHGRTWEGAFAELLTHIRRGPVHPPAGDDHITRYLETVYQHLVGFLAQTVHHYIELHADFTPDAVDSPEIGRRLPNSMLRQLFVRHGFSDADTTERFTNFTQAVEHFGGRVLLLGEPGSGKTTVLMSYARDAVAARLQNSSSPLPLLGILSTWDPSASIAEWLAAGYADLQASDVARVIETGQALLLLDGLDEVSAPEGPSESRERQARFLSQLPSNNSVIITCRSEEYRQIGTLAALAGAVTLQPVTYVQVKAYLADLPELLDTLQASPDLHAIVATPLLLNLIAASCRNLTAAERAELLNLATRPGDLRDSLVERFVRIRYEWEKLRATSQHQQLSFSLKETQSYLGRLAMENAGSFRKVASREGWYRGSPISANRLIPEDFHLVLGNDSARLAEFVRFARQLDVIVQQVDGSLAFRHLLVRDALAYPYSLQNLYTPHLYGTLVEIVNPAQALAESGKARAVDPLVELLHNAALPSIMRECASAALGATGDARCVDILVENLKRREFLFRSGHALGRLGDARAFDSLVKLLQYPGKNGMRGAAYGLGGLGDVRAIPFLRAALGQIQDEDDAFTIDIIMDALCWLGEPGMTAVLEVIQGALKEPDPYVAARGAFKFGASGDRRALNLLLREASDANPAIRAAVAQSLAWSGFPDEAGPALVRLLSDSEKVLYTGRRVRDVAAEALQKMKELQQL